MTSPVKSGCSFAQTSLSDCLKIFPCSLGGCVVRLTSYLRALGLFVVWHPNPASSKSLMIFQIG